MSHALSRARSQIVQMAKEPVVLVTLITIVALLGIFILYPLFKVIQLSLMPDGVFSFSVYEYIFAHPRFRGAITNSIMLGAIVATLATAVAYLFAYSISRTKMAGKKAFKILVYLPIIAPPFMFGIAIILLFGNNGLITAGLFNSYNYSVYGLHGLIITQTVGLFPLAYLMLVGILQGIDPDLETCAMNLGASRLRTFFTVTFPLSAPGILAAWLLIFVASMTDFGTPILLGGNFDVLSVQAYLEFTGMGNLPRGAALAVILIIPTIGTFLLQRHILSKRTYTTITGKATRHTADTATPLANGIFFSICLAICLFMLMFYVVIIVCMFIKIWGVNWSFTLEHFVYAWDVSLGVLWNTTLLAAVATPITACISVLIAYFIVRKTFPGKKYVAILSMMMFAVPGTAVGIGYILAFNEGPILLTGTAYIIIACFIFRTMPIGVEASIASLKQISNDIEESSANLGASTAMTFKRITLPLITPAFFASATFTFIRSMTSLSAVIILISANWNLLTPLLLSQTENLMLAQASITSLILCTTLIIGIYIIKKITKLGQERIFGKTN